MKILWGGRRAATPVSYAYAQICFHVNLQVDKAAIALMTDRDLIEMGIVAKGDRVKLKAFCESKNQSNEDERAVRKRKLKEILEAGKLLRQPTSASKGKQQNTPKAGKKQALKFEIRWKHFNEDSGYETKRVQQGGGMPTVHMKKDASALECLEEIKNIFFPEDETRDKW